VGLKYGRPEDGNDVITHKINTAVCKNKPVRSSDKLENWKYKDVEIKCQLDAKEVFIADRKQ